MFLRLHCLNNLAISDLILNILLPAAGTSGDLTDGDTETCTAYTNFDQTDYLEATFGQSRTYGEVVVKYKGN